MSVVKGPSWIPGLSWTGDDGKRANVIRRLRLFFIDYRLSIANTYSSDQELFFFFLHFALRFGLGHRTQEKTRRANIVRAQAIHPDSFHHGGLRLFRANGDTPFSKYDVISGLPTSLNKSCDFLVSREIFVFPDNNRVENARAGPNDKITNT